MMEEEYLLEWEDVEDAAKSMFRTWIDSGEVEWAKECWQHFRACGLTKAGDIKKETTAKIRLLALCWYYQDFCIQKWDEGFDDSDREVLNMVEKLELNPIALGVLAISEDSYALDGLENEREFEEFAFKLAISGVREQVYDCLLQAYGDVLSLYLRMSRTTVPLGADYDEQNDMELTGYNLQAYSFIDNRFRM